jgi:predicted nucleotidyltransferase
MKFISGKELIKILEQHVGNMEARTLPIKIDAQRIAEFCRRLKIKELDLFGSVLREDFNSNSDVDLIVTFEADAQWGFFDLIIMEDELKEILGREVDLVERRAVERSENYIRRRHILQSLEPLYVA